MAHSIIINSDAFCDSINSFGENVKQVNESLNRISNVMKEIDGNNETWKSKTALEVHEKFTETENNFESISVELSNFEKFLKDTLESYKNEEQKLEKSLDNQYSNFDVHE